MMTTLQPTASAHKPTNVSATILAFAAAVALLYFGRVFLITLIIAVIIAFLLDPVVMVFVKLRLPRPLASFAVCSISVAVVYLMGLALFTEFAGLAEDLPTYSQRINTLVDSVATRVDQMEKTTYELVVPKRFQPPDPSLTASKTGRKRRPVG